MKTLLYTIAIASATVIKLTQAQEKLGFVYELVRHGARAPIIDEPEGYFEVKKGYLTATGMRQRTMLGKVNRERYIEREKLLDEVYNPSQLYIQSTGVDRTLQSTYSELLGLYPPTSSSTKSRLLSSKLADKALPPLRVRSKPSPVGLAGALR